MVKDGAVIINIALIGGGRYCEAILKMTTLSFLQDQVNSRIVAVVDADENAPGVRLARRLGLKIVADYQQLYDPACDIHLFILLDPDSKLLHEVLETKPRRLRVLAYQAFDLFWKAFKSREVLLQQRSEEIQTILNGIQDLILVFTPDQKIVEANDAFLKYMGYGKEDVIGKKCYEVYQQSDQSCHGEKNGCPLKTVIRNRLAAETIRTRIGSDGNVRYMEVSIHPIWEKDGKISRLIEISHDFTERRLQEEENRRRLERMVEERTRQLQDTHAKLLHQDKMASLGKLAASVVHEINNPIAGILNLALLMKRILMEEGGQYKKMEPFDRYLSLMETETRRISRIVSNLLTFSRQSKMELGSQDINRLIERTLLLNDNLLKISNVKINKDLDTSLPLIIGSADQIQQVFMNMISNAAEAMEGKGGGVLTVKTWCCNGKDSICIAFADSGVGIAIDNLDKLFEPFYTTKKQSKGVGLGLSVVYGIIKAHNGSITVDTERGQGATFTIRLPLSPERPRKNTANADNEAYKVEER